MVLKERFTILCQHDGLSCFGCCGQNFGDEGDIDRVIKKNSSDLKKMKKLIDFRDRYARFDLDKGVCRNLVKADGKLICPLHPSLNGGEDLREGHCDAGYLCETAKEFNSWKEEKQKAFLNFIGSKKMTHYRYSIRMADGSLLEEFKRKDMIFSSTV